MTIHLPLPLILALLLAGCGAEREQGSALGEPAALPSPAGAGSAEPNLAVGPEGEVYLSWLQEVGDSAHELRFAVLRDGEWSAPRTIARGSDWFVNWADFPSVVALPDGRLAAHYLQRDPNATRSYDYGVRIVQSSDGGATWSAPVTPHRDGVPAEHGFVSLYAAGGDSLGAVWLDGRKADPRFGGRHEMTLRATTLSADGALGEEHEVDGLVCDCCQTSVAHASRGPVAVYRNRTADEVRDIHVTRRTEAGWQAGRPVHRDGWHIEACPVNGPAVAAEGERVAVAWFTAAADTPRVRVAFSEDSGDAFGAPVQVDTGDPTGRVDVELLPGGLALVSWLERTAGGGAEVRARVVSAQGGAGAPITVAASTSERAGGFPRMARTGEWIIFAWTEPGDSPRVRVARARIGAAT